VAEAGTGTTCASRLRLPAGVLARSLEFGGIFVVVRVASADWKFPEEVRGPLSSAIPDPTWLRDDHGYFEGSGCQFGCYEGREQEAVITDALAATLIGWRLRCPCDRQTCQLILRTVAPGV